MSSRRVLVSCAIVFCVLAGIEPAAVAQGSGPLDGWAFVGDTGRKGKAAEDKDEIIFRDGKFRSVGCDPYGFDEVPYKAIVTADMITFQSEALSDTNGKIEWRGLVRGDAADVTYVWHRPRRWYRPWSSEVEYWFRGKRKS
jgi:hypothetical protein